MFFLCLDNSLRRRIYVNKWRNMFCVPKVNNTGLLICMTPWNHIDRILYTNTRLSKSLCTIFSYRSCIMCLIMLNMLKCVELFQEVSITPVYIMLIWAQNISHNNWHWALFVKNFPQCITHQPMHPIYFLVFFLQLNYMFYLYKSYLSQSSPSASLMFLLSFEFKQYLVNSTFKWFR